MYRAAYMSKFGDQVDGNGGIWQLSNIAFEDTMDTRGRQILPLKYLKIWQAYGILWKKVKYRDLKKPFYSALGARLYLSNFEEPIPRKVSGQAQYWKFKYTRGDGDMPTFEQKSSELNQS